MSRNLHEKKSLCISSTESWFLRAFAQVSAQLGNGRIPCGIFYAGLDQDTHLILFPRS